MDHKVTMSRKELGRIQVLNAIETGKLQVKEATQLWDVTAIFATVAGQLQEKEKPGVDLLGLNRGLT